jgi:hypothetical protein
MALLLLANADNEFHQREKELIYNTAELLGYKINLGVLQRNFQTQNPDKYIDVLAEMTEKNKEFFIMWALDMIHVDGKVTHHEEGSIYAIFRIMNITPEKVKYTIGKMNALNNMFR